MTDTWSRTELLKARADDHPPATNGTAPGARAPGPPERKCEVCGGRLKATQKRACSRQCTARLGGAATRGMAKGKPQARRKPVATASRERDDLLPNVTAPAHSDGLVVLLASLPDAVVALELAGGWRCVRT